MASAAWTEDPVVIVWPSFCSPPAPKRQPCYVQRTQETGHHDTILQSTRKHVNCGLLNGLNLTIQPRSRNNISNQSCVPWKISVPSSAFPSGSILYPVLQYTGCKSFELIELKQAKAFNILLHSFMLSFQLQAIIGQKCWCFLNYPTKAS